jgi:hypothetical protein
MMKLLSLSAFVMTLVLASGCGETRDPNLPNLVPVSGTVKLDGMPLAGASVNFYGDAAGSTGSAGKTNAKGVYKLHTLHNGDGAPVGRYVVSISKLVKPDGSDLPANEEFDAMSSPHKELLLPKYSDMNQTNITATIPEGGGTIDFDLSSK